jgi:hypothetical protein
VVMAPPTICSRHGQTPSVLVCDHIAAAVRLDTAAPPYGRVRAAFGVFESRYLVCLDCIDRFGLVSKLSIPLEGDFDESEFPRLLSVCAKCFAALLVAHHHAV